MCWPPEEFFKLSKGEADEEMLQGPRRTFFCVIQSIMIILL